MSMRSYEVKDFVLAQSNGSIISIRRRIGGGFLVEIWQKLRGKQEVYYFSGFLREDISKTDTFSFLIHFFYQAVKAFIISSISSSFSINMSHYICFITYFFRFTITKKVFTKSIFMSSKGNTFVTIHK